MVLLDIVCIPSHCSWLLGMDRMDKIFYKWFISAQLAKPVLGYFVSQSFALGYCDPLDGGI